MMRVLDLRDTTVDPRTVMPRAALDVEAALEHVRPIVADVAARGAAAVLDWSERVDGVRPTALRVPAEASAQALRTLDPAVRDGLKEAIRRVRIVHQDQRREDVTTEVVDGGVVTERWIPVDRVGLYVPGGRAVYPSSVIMNAIPAQVAGVPSFAVVSPPQKEFGGLPHPTILAACALLGVDEVYAAGGAQAVAMLAYGVDLPEGGRCEPVNMVTGPGNVYVTAAKRLLMGRIGIDAEAGPTEIAILADETANATYVAADLVAQAEHDVIAASVLVTTSPELADDVLRQLPGLTLSTKHSERITESLAGQQSGIILVRDLEQGLAVVNAYAAEHLEIQTADARAVALRVRNAGAVFIGDHTPVPLGDYIGGSNHVLPTAGVASHSSGLSVQTFLRGVHFIEYSDVALKDVADQLAAVANAEDLPGHAQAVAVRFA